MKAGGFWISLLICVALFGSATSQSKTSQPDPPTLKTALNIEDPEARIAALQQLLKARLAADQADAAREASLSKRHHLQGPIDDAFLDSFLVVRPTGSPLNAQVGAWVSSELARATNEWRRHFRGDARVKDDVAVTDADLAAWNAPACDLPRLTLLGPVHARTHGDPYAATERKAYYTELLAWFALHPGGGTSEQLRNALSISANRVRVDVKAVRDWLGVNPRTGTKHLPDARESAAGKAQGRGVYQVEGLLTDLDLFRRLRARGAARGGEAGMTDLATALTLVTGAPFTGCREGGWGWLFEGDRVDEHMVCAIVDVAHLVVTDALHRGDTALANAAAQVAAQAAPYADTPKLDLAAIARAQGRMSDAAAIIKEDVCEWTNEPGTPPTELPERTRQILAGDAFTAKAS